jgi:hypothetical protein
MGSDVAEPQIGDLSDAEIDVLRARLSKIRATP